MPNAKSIGWAIYAVGFVVWLFGYLSAGHVSVIDWDVAKSWWISNFVPNLEAELGLALMFASMVPIYWRAGGSAMADPPNVVRLTPERRERVDRQRALASAYRLEAAVAHISADVRPAENRNKAQGAGRRAVADFAVIILCGKQHPSQLPAPLG